MLSSTEPRADVSAAPRPVATGWRTGGLGRWRDAALDVRHIMAFHGQTVRKRWVVRFALGLIALVTALFAFAGALVEPDEMIAMGYSLEDALPYAFPAVLLLALAAAMGGGGGKELLPSTQGHVHPLGPLVDHLGALLLVPLNLAWLLQVWLLLALTAMAVDGHLLGSHLVVLLWALAASSIGQGLGWMVEGVRRTEHGKAVVWASGAVLAVAGLVTYRAGALPGVVQALPSTWVVDSLGTAWWPLAALALLPVIVLAVWLGGIAATWALSRPSREQQRNESGVYPAREAPRRSGGFAQGALLRQMDRDSVWRSIGMRRGLLMLGLGPGLIALVMGMSWGEALILPGLAASGAALLFGINAFCLDGRGAVWRETLPIDPLSIFDARARVLAECLAVVSVLTLVAPALRNGLPDANTALALALFWSIVVLQVVAVSMSWSLRSPYAVDLSSPRAVPAPPGAMLGYAARLSLVTTLSGMLFGGLASIGVWWLTLALAVPFWLWSGTRLLLVRRRWRDAEVRARVALTVVP